MSNMTIHRIRLSTMQKIVNLIAVASGVVSLAVVGSGLYVYVNRDAITDGIKQQAMDAVLGGLGSFGGEGLGVAAPGAGLPVGANDISPVTSDPTPQASSNIGTGAVPSPF